MNEIHSGLFGIQHDLDSFKMNISSQAGQQNLTTPELVYKRVKDSIVLIKATVVVETIFGKIYALRQGSGFVYNELGHIVTNYYVVENAIGINAFSLDKKLV